MFRAFDFEPEVLVLREGSRGSVHKAFTSTVDVEGFGERTRGFDGVGKVLEGLRGGSRVGEGEGVVVEPGAGDVVDVVFFGV